MQIVFLNEKGKEEQRCRLCNTNYQISSGTRTIEDHLKFYNIIKDLKADAKAKNIQIDIANAIALAAKHPQKRRKLNDSDNRSMPLNRDVLKVLYVKFISACNLPLSLIKAPEFKAFLLYLNSDIDRQLPVAHKTVRTWVLCQFTIKEKIKIQL